MDDHDKNYFLHTRKEDNLNYLNHKLPEKIDEENKETLVWPNICIQCLLLTKPCLDTNLSTMFSLNSACLAGQVHGFRMCFQD